MGKLSTVLMVSAVGVVLLAYVLWTPLPDNLDQKGFVRVVAATKKVWSCLEWTGSVFFGIDDMSQYGRAFGSMLMPTTDLNSDPQLQVTNEVFSGIQVRVYRPKSAPVPSPVLMHFHGGGFTLGSIDAEDTISRYLAKLVDVVVVSVEYRLAPEYPFPAALDDCATATVHVLTHGPKLGLDPSKVGVIGISAGGNLATTVSLRLQDAEFQGLPRLAYQVMLNSNLQAVDFSLPSFIDNDPLTGVIVSRQDLARCLASYAGLDVSPATIQQIRDGQHIRKETRSKLAKYIHRDLLTEKKSSSLPAENSGSVNETLAQLAEPVVLNYLVSPLLAPEDILKRLPRAMVVMSPYDILHDEALLYVRRLRQAGVDVTSHTITNGQHMSMVVLGSEPGSEVAAEAYQKLKTFIKKSISS